MTGKTDSPYYPARKEHYKQLGNSVVKALVSNGHNAMYCETSEEALREVLSIIPEDASVGIPGSVTIREIGALDKLKERGNKVYHHWDPDLDAKGKTEKRGQENSADVILTGSNALTIGGVLVNMDGIGNRVSAMAWGQNKIIFVVGINKIERDLSSAMQRVRDKATPSNAIRLNIETPCTKTGYCMNCNSENRVCRALLILEKATTGRESWVIIVGEDLGY